MCSLRSLYFIPLQLNRGVRQSTLRDYATRRKRPFFVARRWQSRKCRVVVNEEDVSLLLSYLSEALRLQGAITRNGGFGASYNFSWEAGKPATISGSGPSDDQLAVLVHRLRPFLLQNEPLYFNSIRGIISRGAESKELKEWLAQTKLRFTGRLSQQQVVVTANDLVLNSEAALEKWLNAFEYHRDLDKADELSKAHSLFPIESSRPIFVMLLQEKAMAVLHLGWLVHKILLAIGVDDVPSDV